MDREGQESNSSAVFTSDNIGTKATPEYFQNVKGGKKNKEKVEKKRTRITRKTLMIILATVAAILVVVVLIFVIINIVNNSKHGERTGEDLPTTIAEVEERTYTLLYDEEKGGYANAISYVNNIILDMQDMNRDETLIFSVFAFRSVLAYQAGGKDAGRNEALRLLNSAKTDRQKFIIYQALDRIYIMDENWDEAQRYEDLMNDLDTSENNADNKAGFDNAVEAAAEEARGGSNEE